MYNIKDLYVLQYFMGLNKSLAIWLTALTLGTWINKSSAKDVSQYSNGFTQQQLQKTLLAPNPIMKNDTNTYTVSPEEIAKSEINHSTEVIDYISKFNKDFIKIYPKEVLSQKINLLIDTNPNFDSLTQDEKNKILMDTFPEFMRHKKLEDWLTLALLSLVITVAIAGIWYTIVTEIKTKKEDKKTQ